ncbi:MAG TPA: CoA transferase [Dehalococcoidia bacterium]|nr:CoA transferase [Dehalococcoidia bacterium]
MAMALEDVRVLDLSGFIAGAYGTRILASFGAEVIMVEPVTGSFMRSIVSIEPGVLPLSSLVNHDKKSVALNLKYKNGKDIFKELAAKADVLVETFRPGTMATLGLDYESLRKVNPRLVYLSQTAYGQTGPYSRDIGYDGGVQATSGMHTLREHPEVAPPIFADIVSSVYGVLGVMIALLYRQKTGQGQYIDLSMNDAIFSQNYLEHLKIVWEGLPNFIIDMSCHPPRCLLGSFKCKDGYVVNSFLQEKQWAAAADVIGEKQMVEDERFANILSRAQNDEAASSIIEGWTSNHTRDEIVDAMVEAGVPCAKVLTLEEVEEDPQLRSRDMLLELNDPDFGKVKVVGIPFKLSETPSIIRTPAPRLGEHTEEILISLLGYSKEEIAKLRGHGVIA